MEIVKVANTLRLQLVALDHSEHNVAKLGKYNTPKHFVEMYVLINILITNTL